MGRTARLTTDAPARTHVSDRDLVGVDSTGASIEAARQADDSTLIVVGSHGQGRLEGTSAPPRRPSSSTSRRAPCLHGVKALGSVSERVAHRAPCSTLIVRDRAGVHPRA